MWEEKFNEIFEKEYEGYRMSEPKKSKRTTVNIVMAMLFIVVYCLIVIAIILGAGTFFFYAACVAAIAYLYFAVSTINDWFRG